MFAVTGALFGGLIALGSSALGIPAALKVGFDLLLPFVFLGALVGITPFRAVLPALGALILLVLVAASYTPLGGRLATSLVRNDSLPAQAPDAIAVLSGGVNSDGTMQPATLDRLLAGIQLSKRYPGAPLMISREQTWVAGKQTSDSADLQRLLLLSGGNTAAIYADSTTSTRVEAVRMRTIARSHGWERLALVTSPLHTRRACATFEAVGFKVTCIAALARSGAASGGTAANGLEMFRGWLYETAGSVKYRYSGWIRPNSFHSKWRRE